LCALVACARGHKKKRLPRAERHRFAVHNMFVVRGGVRRAAVRRSHAAFGRACAQRVPRRQPFASGGAGGPKPSAGGNGGLGARFWAWTTQQRPHWRESPVEAAVLFCVFGITGSSSVALVRPFLKNTIGLEGTMREGPWSYRIGSLVLVSPIYATVLIFTGTVAGRHMYFAMMGRKILGRFLPRKLGQKIGCEPARVKQELSRGVKR